MDKKEVLQFEAGDMSKTGINGKQVFFTKRINGEIIHNKEIEKESRQIPENEDNDLDKEELFIEFKNVKYKQKDVPQNKTINKKKKRKKIKSKKHKKRNRILKILFLLLLLVAAIIFAMVSPIFNIDTIDVIGNEKVDTDTIISLSGVPNGKNIFQISKNNITKNIKENPYINEVTIKRNLPGTLQITVQERKAAYQIKVINSFVYIDYQGYILEVSSNSMNVPEIEGFLTEQDILLKGKRLSNDDIESLRIILRIIETAKAAEISKLISKIIIQNNDYILELKKENKIVYLGNAKNPTNQMTYVKLILENEKGNKGKIFVNGDINNGFKPYFREE